MGAENLKLGDTWDEDVRGWGADLVLGKKHKAAKAPSGKSSWSGAPVPRAVPPDYAGRGSKADVFKRLNAIAGRHQQVMVKNITQKGRKTSRQLADHFKYLSRDNEEALYDQNGNKITDKEAMLDLVWAWKNVGPALDDASDRKETFHIIFSMREGTDEKATFEAVKATVGIEFSGHQWVMAQHFDEPQVHVHVSVKTEGFDGLRLNPRKPDIQRWRERFAHELRERGVEAEATRRKSRLHQEKVAKPWAVAQMEGRDLATNPAPAAVDPARAAAWRRSEVEATDYYDKLVKALARSSDADDRKLAEGLQHAMLDELAKNRYKDPKDRPQERAIITTTQLERS